ncbi:hypothetical protein HK097_005989, partial [Rhizophlyctis rosea]
MEVRDPTLPPRQPPPLDQAFPPAAVSADVPRVGGVGRNERGAALPSIRDILGTGMEGAGAARERNPPFGGGGRVFDNIGKNEAVNGAGMVGDAFSGGMDEFGNKRGREESWGGFGGEDMFGRVPSEPFGRGPIPVPVMNGNERRRVSEERGGFGDGSERHKRQKVEHDSRGLDAGLYRGGAGRNWQGGSHTLPPNDPMHDPREARLRMVEQNLEAQSRDFARSIAQYRDPYGVGGSGDRNLNVGKGDININTNNINIINNHNNSISTTVTTSNNTNNNPKSHTDQRPISPPPPPGHHHMPGPSSSRRPSTSGSVGGGAGGGGGRRKSVLAPKWHLYDHERHTYERLVGPEGGLDSGKRGGGGGGRGYE